MHALTLTPSGYAESTFSMLPDYVALETDPDDRAALSVLLSATDGRGRVHVVPGNAEAINDALTILANSENAHADETTGEEARMARHACQGLCTLGQKVTDFMIAHPVPKRSPEPQRATILHDGAPLFSSVAQLEMFA